MIIVLKLLSKYQFHYIYLASANTYSVIRGSETLKFILKSLSIHPNDRSSWSEILNFEFDGN